MKITTMGNTPVTLNEDGEAVIPAKAVTYHGLSGIKTFIEEAELAFDEEDETSDDEEDDDEPPAKKKPAHVMVIKKDKATKFIK